MSRILARFRVRSQAGVGLSEFRRGTALIRQECARRPDDPRAGATGTECGAIRLPVPVLSLRPNFKIRRLCPCRRLLESGILRK